MARLPAKRRSTKAKAARPSAAPPVARPVAPVSLDTLASSLAGPGLAVPSPVSLNHEVREFRSTADTIAIGDLSIRKNFADRVMVLFAIANVGVLIGLGFIFWQDCSQLAAGHIRPADRIIDGQVIMALLGATTIQLGTVIYTITRAIFPTGAAPKGAGGGQ